MGGSKPKAAQVVQNAPGSVAAASIDDATVNSRDEIREKLKNARGRSYTNNTNGAATSALKKALLGE